MNVPISQHGGGVQIATAETRGDANLYRQMTVAFASVEDSASARLLYLASFSFIHYLLEEHGGWARVRKTVGELAAGEDLPQAMDSAYRRTLGELEDEWIESLERRGRSTR